ncbi:hypothetical protein IFR05_013159 [Cadophora sp. M221]|nr:hypothetical protein IFR05_013159 [Cadophora sp. M221]
MSEPTLMVTRRRFDRSSASFSSGRLKCDSEPGAPTTMLRFPRFTVHIFGISSNINEVGKHHVCPQPLQFSSSRATRTATITSTGIDGGEVTITQVVGGQTTAPTGSRPTASIQVPSGNDNANDNTSGSSSGSSTSGSTSSSKQSLSPGAIAGIVIGSLGVLALFLVAFLLYRRNSKKGNSQGSGGLSGGAVESYTGGMQQESAPGYSAVPQNQDNYPIPVSEFKSPALSAASPVPTGYTQNQPHGTELPSPADGRPGVYEAPVQQSWEGRAEMGSNRG